MMRVKNLSAAVMRAVLTAFACLYFFVFMSATIRSEDAATADSAKQTLADKGLKKVGLYFTLSDEVDVKRVLREIDLLRKQLRESQRKLVAADEQVEKKRKLMINYIQQRRRIRSRLTQQLPVNEHNRLVTMSNELGDRLNLMEKDQSAEDAAKQVRAAHENLQSEYVDKLLATRKLYDQVAEKYEDMKADREVASAVAEFNKTATKPCKLGPGLSFASLGRKLKKIEDTVLSEAIELRKGGGNLWIVPVAFNDGKAQPMAIDTGASIISLPWQLAETVGLTPGPDDPKMRVSMADGRIVMATRKIAKKVRVGKFTVENVECSVMPKEFTQAAPLLGLSFFKHFTFKIDTANAKLVMAKVESLDGKPLGKSLGKSSSKSKRKRK